MKIGRRKRGPISKKVKVLCQSLFEGKLGEKEFTQGIQEIINEYGNTGYILQGIGMALQKWSSNKNHSKRELVWKLADRVDVRIRNLYERWEKIILE
jgi:hypothetical protein